jgi:5-methylthioadenosine/S-adenosylhomocysteine deaminase
MAAAGAFAPGLVAAHCVRLVPGDARVLAAAGVAVAHCPRSNAHLRCGRAPLEALRDAGARVALGTDSPASGGDYDVRAEARAAADLHAGALDLDAAALLRMATLGGAEALGMDDEVGALAPGRRADLVALADPGGGRPPEARAMDPAAAVDVVAVDGEVLLRDGAPTRADGAAIGRAAAEARGRLC